MLAGLVLPPKLHIVDTDTIGNLEPDPGLGLVGNPRRTQRTHFLAIDGAADPVARYGDVDLVPFIDDQRMRNPLGLGAKLLFLFVG
jgi:hypothetical protein